MDAIERTRQLEEQFGKFDMSFVIYFITFFNFDVVNLASRLINISCTNNAQVIITQITELVNRLSSNMDKFQLNYK